MTGTRWLVLLGAARLASAAAACSSDHQGAKGSNAVNSPLSAGESGTGAASGTASSPEVSQPTPVPAALPGTCERFLWGLTALDSIAPNVDPPGSAAPTPYGNPAYTRFGSGADGVNAVFNLNAWPWRLAADWSAKARLPDGSAPTPLAYYFPAAPAHGLVRLHALTMASDDCGLTWARLAERLAPLMIDGKYDQTTADPATNDIGNGVNHLVRNAHTFPSAFATHIDYTSLRSRIFPVFEDPTFAFHLVYQAVVGGALPNPAVGNPNWNSPSADNFYSPTIVPLAGQDLRLYFGGWRDYTTETIGACLGPNAGTGAPTAALGPTEEACTCTIKPSNVPSVTGAAGAVDACTGDKIFVASNEGQANKLALRVYAGAGQWTADAFQSQYFRPVISSSRLNNSCVGGSAATCPYSLFHTNDPTVLKLPAPVTARFATNATTATAVVPAANDVTYQYIMFFSGAVLVPATANAPLSTYNFTHVGLSMDGLSWQTFAVLRHKPGVVLPGAEDYSESNGMVRAMYDGAHGKIVLMAQANELIAGGDELFDYFRYVVDPSSPNLIEDAGRLNDANGNALKLPYACPVEVLCGKVQHQ